MTSWRRVHPAWIVLGALTVCMMAASGLRAMFGVYVKPMEAEFGWSRTALSGVAAVSILLLGASGPLIGRLADRWSPRRVIAAALVVLGLGAVASSAIQTLWQLYVTMSVLALGAGGVAMTTGVTVVTRWFEERRGLALGIAAGGMSAGQLVVIPLAAAITVWFGWRSSFFWLGIGVLLLVVPLGAWLVRNAPEDRGRSAYGARRASPGALRAASAAPAGRRVSFGEASRSPQFWLLMSTFFVCGYTTFGIVVTHFMPHALEHHFTEFQASSALGVMGAMNVIGTVGSGWLCDRFGRRGPLATYYFVRGLSLVFLMYVWDVPSLHLWAAIFGLNFISTVPPTTALTATIFGRTSVGELSGWIFFAHQAGGALGAALSGWIFEATGSYSSAFMLAAVLAIVAAGLALAIREEPVTEQPVAVPAA
jgi:MFS family permease